MQSNNFGIFAIAKNVISIAQNFPSKCKANKEGDHQCNFELGGVDDYQNFPHPNAARVFVNWLLSKEGQEIYGKAHGQATGGLISCPVHVQVGGHFNYLYRLWGVQ